MRVANSVIVAAGDMSAVSVTSSVYEIGFMSLVAVQASWTGSSPVGTLKLQASNDGTTWTDLTGTLSVSSNSGSGLLQLADVAYPKLRAVYTKTSGTGTLKVVASGKGAQ